MLERAQERVRRVQRLAVLAADVPTRGERVERAQGRRVRGACSSVRPCTSCRSWTANSTSRSPPEPSLSWRSASRAGMFSTHPSPHRLDVADEAVALGDLPHHRLDQRRGTRCPSAEVAGDRPGLEQGLELPGLGPALVVGAVARQGADQRTGLALRTQVGVDRPDRALAGVLGADLHQLRGELGGDPGGRGLVGTLRRLEDVEHVDVGDVVQLVAAALAERDHRQPGAARRPGPADRAIASAASSVPAARSDSSAAASSTPRWWARSRAASRVSSRRYSTRSASTASPRPAGSRSGASFVGIGADRLAAAPRGRRTPRGGWSRGTGRPARATARGAGTGGRPAPGSHRARTAAASRCPRRRRARRRAPARRARPAGSARPGPGRGRPCGPAERPAARPRPRAGRARRARGPESSNPSRSSRRVDRVAAGAHRVNVAIVFGARGLRRGLESGAGY